MRWPHFSFALRVIETSSEPQVRQSTVLGFTTGVEDVRKSEPKTELRLRSWSFFDAAAPVVSLRASEGLVGCWACDVERLRCSFGLIWSG